MKTYSTLTDDELVRLYEEGNDGAFDMLLERHQEKLFNYIFFLTRNEDLANDVFQDTFVRAITTIRSHRYEGTGNFGAWLLCISRHLVIDHHRRARTMNTVSHEFLDEKGDVKGDLLNNASLCAPTIEDNILSRESVDSLRMMIDKLPDAQREIVYLRYYRDLSFKEIAQVLDLSINTALGRARYAILNLRRMATSYNLSLVG